MRIASALFVTAVVGGWAVAETTPIVRRPMIQHVAAGAFVSVDDKTLVVKNAPRDGGPPADVRVDLAAEKDVQILIDLERYRPTDLRPGMTVDVQRVSSAQGLGLRISAQSPALSGKLLKVDGPTLTLDVGDGNAPRVVRTDEWTLAIIFGPSPDQPRVQVPLPGPVSDLVAGMNVRVIPPTGVAEKIIAVPDRRAATRPTH